MCYYEKGCVLGITSPHSTGSNNALYMLILGAKRATGFISVIVRLAVRNPRRILLCEFVGECVGKRGQGKPSGNPLTLISRFNIPT